MAWNIINNLTPPSNLAEAPHDCSCNCICYCECPIEFSSTQSQRSGAGLWGTHAGNNGIAGIKDPITSIF